jgi:hypothetical protein
METLERFLLVSAIVLFAIVFYRWLLRYLRRNEINDPYPYLFPFEKQPLSGKEVLKFDMPYAARVKAEVFSDQGRMLFISFDQEISKGIHLMAFDVSSLPQGAYELKITFPNQVIRRPFSVES